MGGETSSEGYLILGGGIMRQNGIIWGILRTFRKI
jgi:hypothetical protein